MFSSILIVTVNTSKMLVSWVLWSNKGQFFPKTQETNYQLKIFQKPYIVLLCATNYKKYGVFLTFLVAILYFANLKVEVTK